MHSQPPGMHYTLLATATVQALQAQEPCQEDSIKLQGQGTGSSSGSQMLPSSLQWVSLQAIAGVAAAGGGGLGGGAATRGVATAAAGGVRLSGGGGGQGRGVPNFQRVGAESQEGLRDEQVRGMDSWASCGGHLE
jgi:hypothetical protein